MKRLLLALFVIIASSAANAADVSHAISMYGDVKYPADFKHFDYVNPNAPKKGSITMPDIGTFNNLNPFILKGESASGASLLFDTLMSASQDETSTNYPLIAQSAEWDKNNNYIIFNINPAARFSDGTQLTAHDVAFSFNTVIEKGHPIYKMYYADAGKPEVLAKYKIKFPIKNPANREMKIILGQLQIFSKEYYKKNDFEKTTLKAPLGSGPYLVEKMQQGRSITFKRNPNYWAKDLPVNKGRYNFDRIIYEYFKDANIAIQAFKSGVIDLRYENIAKNWATAYNIPQIKSGEIKKEKIRHQIPQGLQGFAFNTRREKFSDVRVRKALSLALDFGWMNKNLFFDSYTRSNSYFANSIYEGSNLPTGKELEILEQYKPDLPPEVFTTAFKMPESDGSGNMRKALLEARNLLKQAGWEVKNGKLTNAKGEVFTIEFLTLNGSSFARIMPSYITNLKKLGIESKIKLVDATVYKKLNDEFDFDMMVNSWGASLSPGNELLDYWHSASANVKGSRNLVGANNKVIDALVQKIVTAEDKETLVASVKALDRVLLWNYYAVPQWYMPYFRILYWDKFAHPTTMPIYDSQFGLYTWWVK